MRILAAFVPELVGLDAAAHAAMIEGLYAFGPTVDVPAVGHEGAVLVDVTGCAGLFGSTAAAGEAVLAHRVVAFFQSIGLRAHVAIAEGPRLATMFARLAQKPLVVGKLDTVAALAAVPLSTMPLSASEVRYFVKLGLAKAGDLMALPAASLALRLEPRSRRTAREHSASRDLLGAEDLMLLLRGEDRAPLQAHVRRTPPCAQIDLPHPTDSTEALAFVLKSLCDSLWPELPGLSLRKATLTLTLDEGPRRARAGANLMELTSTFAPALGNREDTLAALRTKLERAFVGASHRQVQAEDDLKNVLRVQLRFDETVPTVLANLSLYSSEARAARALPRLLAELREGLGEEHVGRLQVRDSWAMHQRSALVSYDAPRSTADPASLLNVLEPTRLAEPGITVGEHEAIRLLVRLERSDWFASAFAFAPAAASPRHEIISAWHDERAVCLERNASTARLLGFFD